MQDKRTAFCRLVVLTVLATVALLSGSSRADIRLPAVVGDNMVLQAGDRVRLWGWADPNEEIEVGVSWRPFKWCIQADDRGDWQFVMNSPDAGGPYEITLKGKNTVAIRNILAGQVWVCSGQSNMQWSVGQSANAEKEVAAAKYPKIRLFSVERKVADTPQTDCTGKWVECSPETVGGFSAVGYFFGRELYKELKMPIGLIHTSWGGTPAEAWTSQSSPFWRDTSRRWPITRRP
jgi:sialate O-acetylesterase